MKKIPVTLALLLIATIIAPLTLIPIHVSAKTSNVQVNAAFAGPFPTNKQNEPSLAQNPTNPLNLIAGSNDEIGEPSCTDTTPSSCPFVATVSVSGFYASFDGGGHLALPGPDQPISLQ